VKIYKQALHWVYLKVQGVEVNFINYCHRRCINAWF
jgi:hypothetical protein